MSNEKILTTALNKMRTEIKNLEKRIEVMDSYDKHIKDRDSEGGIMNIPALLTVPDLAKELRFSKQSIYKFLASGKIESFTIHGSKRITRESLDKFIAAQTQKEIDKLQIPRFQTNAEGILIKRTKKPVSELGRFGHLQLVNRMQKEEYKELKKSYHYLQLRVELLEKYIAENCPHTPYGKQFQKIIDEKLKQEARRNNE